jgi:hypothetical protein
MHGWMDGPEAMCTPGCYGYSPINDESEPPPSCPNFELCGQKAPGELQDCWHGRCLNCDMKIRKNLTITDAPGEWECPICLTHKDRAVKYPTQCEHLVCIECLKRLCGWTLPLVNPELDDEVQDASGMTERDRAEEERNENMGRLKPCPLCRHRHQDAPDNSW